METRSHHKYVFLYKPECPDFCGLTRKLSTRTPMNSRRHHLTRAAFRLFRQRAFKRAACCCLCHHERTGLGHIRAVAQEILYSFVVCSLGNFNWWTFHALCARHFFTLLIPNMLFKIFLPRWSDMSAFSLECILGKVLWSPLTTHQKGNWSRCKTR